MQTFDEFVHEETLKAFARLYSEIAKAAKSVFERSKDFPEESTKVVGERLSPPETEVLKLVAAANVGGMTMESVLDGFRGPAEVDESHRTPIPEELWELMSDHVGDRIREAVAEVAGLRGSRGPAEPGGKATTAPREVRYREDVASDVESFSRLVHRLARYGPHLRPFAKELDCLFQSKEFRRLQEFGGY